jgi:hypothetical protein
MSELREQQILPRPVGGTHTRLTDAQMSELVGRAKECAGKPYTPRLRNGRRIGIALDFQAWRQVAGRGLRDRGIVTDLNTGNKYRILGASCDLRGCECDAIAINVSWGTRKSSTRLKLLRCHLALAGARRCWRLADGYSDVTRGPCPGCPCRSRVRFRRTTLGVVEQSF